VTEVVETAVEETAEVAEVEAGDVSEDYVV
jgi:hypothetical protein